MPFDERDGRPVHQFSDEGWSLYVMGRISYMDDGGAERFMAFCRQRLAHYKCPRTVVFTTLPKTSTGKVQKYVLREMAKKLND